MNDFDLTALIDRHNIKAIYRIKAMDSVTVVLQNGRFASGVDFETALANAEKPDAQNVMGPINSN